MSPTDESQVRNHTKCTDHLTTTITMVLEMLARLPLQRCGFDEPMPLEGWTALHMFLLRPPLKQFDRFNKLK